MPKILVVDDLLSERKLTGHLLSKREGWSVEFANNGREAIEMIREAIPNLVLTDLNMPEMDGLELVTVMHDEFPQVPVVLMTARGSEKIAVEAIQKGAASYVPKKALSQDLLPTLEQVLDVASERVDDRWLSTKLTTISYTLENDLALIGAFVGSVRQTLLAKDLVAEGDSLRLASALNEAMQNAYYHGNLEVDSSLRDDGSSAFFDLAEQRRGQDPYGDRRIEVNVAYSDTSVSFQIKDEGPGFDVNNLPDPTDLSYLERPHGRGVFLIRAFVDEVRFNDKGNEITLVKHLDSSD